MSIMVQWVHIIELFALFVEKTATPCAKIVNGRRRLFGGDTWLSELRPGVRMMIDARKIIG